MATPYTLKGNLRFANGELSGNSFSLQSKITPSILSLPWASSLLAVSALSTAITLATKRTERILVSLQNHTESQNVRGWQGPLWVTQPNPLPKQGHPEQAAQHRVQAGLEYLQRRRLHSLPGQPGPVLRHQPAGLRRGRQACWGLRQSGSKRDEGSSLPLTPVSSRPSAAGPRAAVPALGSPAPAKAGAALPQTPQSCSVPLRPTAPAAAALQLHQLLH